MWEQRAAKVLFIGSFILGSASCASTTQDGPTTSSENFDLVIFHNNDGESQLLHAGSGLENHGGIANFAAKLSALRAELPEGLESLFLSSGDNILPGPEFRVSLENQTTFFDAIAINHLAYTALCLGNHDFDLGPDTLARFIGDVDPNIPFLAANLDFSAEPKLQALVEKGQLAKHHIVTLKSGHKVGIIGIITPRLPNISAPRKVKVRSDLAEVVRKETEHLKKKGINKIILLSHLQDISLEIDLVKQVSDIDIVIGGGGDELLSNTNTLLVPGDEKLTRGPYPLMAMDKSGHRIPVVTTAGSYRYIGKVIVRFDAGGNVVATLGGSAIYRIDKPQEKANIQPDQTLSKEIIDPLKKALSKISQSNLAATRTRLDGRRSKVRSQETGLGNLVADAFLWYGQQQAPKHDLEAPLIALVNAGAIRNDSLLPKGTLTELDAFKILPLPGFVSLVSNVAPHKLKAIMEYSLNNIGGGGFLQVSGMRMEYDAGRSVDRVRSLVLKDGREIIKDGLIVEDAPAVSIATLSFLARGGGKIPMKGLDSSNLAANYQKSLSEYLKSIKRVSRKEYGHRKAQRIIPIKSK